MLRTSCALSHIRSVHVIGFLLAVKGRPQVAQQQSVQHKMCVRIFCTNPQFDAAANGSLLRHEMGSHDILVLCYGCESATAA